MKVSAEYIVSTDLDGTLLDHHTYDWKAALPAIEILNQKHIPIIFNTSKTLEEVNALQQLTDISGPKIIENGSALYLPKSQFDNSMLLDDSVEINELENEWQIVFGEKRKKILDFIHVWREQNGNLLEGFNDWTLQKIMAATSLTEDKAKLSVSKLYSEPFVWHGNASQLSQLRTEAERNNLQILQGGRFYHLQGETDKGKPLTWLKQKMKAAFASEPKLICLGDNKNDIQMLDIADYAVCVKSPVSSYPHIHTSGEAIYTKGFGPVGWNEAIHSILQQSSL